MGPGPRHWERDRESTGVTHNVKDGAAPLKGNRKPRWNGMQASRFNAELLKLVQTNRQQ